MSHAPFVHLRVHTAYSLSEGAIRVKDLAKRCAELGMPAVAMADTGNLHGVYSFTNAMLDAGVQPIIGVQMQLAASDGAKSPIVLLAKDKTGYFNLIRAVSEAALRGDGKAETFLVPRDLKDHQEGLILLTGGPRGPIDTAIRQGREDLARKRLEFFKETFGDRAYVEIQRLTPTAKGSPGERRLIALADDLGMPLVATNEAFYLTRDMREAQDVLLCIADGSYLTEQDRRRVDPEAYLKTPEQMCEIFADLPDAVANTVAIAQRCAVAFQKHKPILPRFPCGEGRSEDDELEHQAQEGLEERFVQLGIADEGKRQEYRERLAFEVDVIKKMKFPGYFLIVSDYIKWAKANDIPVGPGRGSGAGSLVAYALKITDLDPIRYGLLFERFLNPERVSMPDFDVDFCEARREEVIEYCRQRYGAERVCQIATFGKLAARAVLRDVGRVLQLPYPVVDKYCKLIPNNPSDPKTLGQAMDMEDVKKAFQEAEPDVQRMFRIGLKLEGLYRHSSKHAAGVVISDRPIHEICPVMRDAKDGVVVAQWDMKGVEPCGLVKFDFLGLRNLDIIKSAIDMAREGGVEIDFDKIGVDDAATYEMIANAETFGVFQLAGGGMRGACRMVRPNTIDDVIALVSLYRPGPMDNIPKYKAVKFGEEQPQYHHPAQESILKDTFSIMIYQEQVMQLAQKMAGYSLGGADLLRRAMGKKIAAEMEAQRAIFVAGCAAGWLHCTLDDGRVVRLHPHGEVKLKGSEEKVKVQDAIDQGLDIDV